MKREREFQAWLQISQGCNCRCSYCIVPSTRGREQSRDPAELVTEVEALAADGVREVTLLGQNVNSYGRDLRPSAGRRFAELLAMLDAIDGIERIRYTSPHPKDMREDVIRAHAELPALCEHIHLPLQSGSTPDPEGDAAHLQPRALPRPRGADPRARPRLRPDHRHHRRLPRRDRGGLRAHARGRRAGRLRRRLHLRLLAAPRHRGGDAARPGRRRRSSASGWSAWSRRSSAAPASAPSASSGGRWRCSSRAAAATDAAQLRGRTRHNKAVNFEGTAGAGRAGRGRDRGRDLADADRARAAAQPRWLSRAGHAGPGDLRADRGRQDRGRDRGRRAAARARRGPGGGLAATRSRSTEGSRS